MCSLCNRKLSLSLSLSSMDVLTLGKWLNGTFTLYGLFQWTRNAKVSRIRFYITYSISELKSFESLARATILPPFLLLIFCILRWRNCFGHRHGSNQSTVHPSRNCLLLSMIQPINMSVTNIDYFSWKWKYFDALLNERGSKCSSRSHWKFKKCIFKTS